jgi:S-(hydroxymethyl)glutathione dehydrogenase/alcohol dehydrogenase
MTGWMSRAVAWEAKKPLSIETVQLEGPKAGEVLVEVMATGVCHTDAYTLDGLDSRAVPRHPRA